MPLSQSEVAAICAELQIRHRQRRDYLKTHLRLETALRQAVANELGYDPRQPKEQRDAKNAEAEAFIEQARKGQTDPANHLTEYVTQASASILLVMLPLARVEAEMRALASKLPVAGWLAQPEQNGVSLLFLAQIVGECGDLTNFGKAISDHPDKQKRRGYYGPARVWAKMSCHPYTFKGFTHMGQAWNKFKPVIVNEDGKEVEVSLGKKNWTEYGYKKTVRALVRLIGKNLMMQNFIGKKKRAAKTGDTEAVTDATAAKSSRTKKRAGKGDDSYPVAESPIAGPYRRRYEEAKQCFKERHPDARPCRCDAHAMAMATKLFLKNLWKVWNGQALDGEHEQAA